MISLKFSTCFGYIHEKWKCFSENWREPKGESKLSKTTYEWMRYQNEKSSEYIVHTIWTRVNIYISQSDAPKIESTCEDEIKRIDGYLNIQEQFSINQKPNKCYGLNVPQLRNQKARERLSVILMSIKKSFRSWLKISFGSLHWLMKHYFIFLSNSIFSFSLRFPNTRVFIVSRQYFIFHIRLRQSTL